MDSKPARPAPSWPRHIGANHAFTSGSIAGAERPAMITSNNASDRGQTWTQRPPQMPPKENGRPCHREKPKGSTHRQHRSASHPLHSSPSTHPTPPAHPHPRRPCPNSPSPTPPAARAPPVASPRHTSRCAAPSSRRPRRRPRARPCAGGRSRTGSGAGPSPAGQTCSPSRACRSGGAEA